MEPHVLYEDADIIVLDKPSGLSVHASGQREEATLADWLLKRYPELAEVGEPMELPNGQRLARPGIVHRLDRDTSGVMVVARTPQSYARLKRQFGNREVQKTYRAFVYGPITEERGLIDKPLGRSAGSGNQRSVRDPRGRQRDARTVFQTLCSTAEASYLEVFPKTGRTHQIRVHLASIGHPVIADPLYAPGKPPMLGFSRLALHALSLAFTHPATGQEVTFTASLPEEFAAAEKELHRA